VTLKEGEENPIKIEVTSESGVAKVYVINAKRLSAKDAVLSGIKVNISNITPDFLPHILQYFCKYFFLIFYVILLQGPLCLIKRIVVNYHSELINYKSATLESLLICHSRHTSVT